MSGINIRFSEFLPGLGQCMDISFSFNGKDYKTFLPLKSIKRIIPNTGKYSGAENQTRVYFDPNSYYVFPIPYDKFIDLLEKHFYPDDEIEMGICEPSMEAQTK